MSDAFTKWATKYIAHIDNRIPMLVTRRITMVETRDGVRKDTTDDLVTELRRQKAELESLISSNVGVNE